MALGLRRRPTRPNTQLARAGERTRILTIDQPVPCVRFRAATFQGDPAGRVEINSRSDRGAALSVVELKPENRIDGIGLIDLAVIPERDTAITFLPVETKFSTPALIGGTILVAGAFGWTLFEMLGG